MSPRRFDALRRLLPLSVLLATLWPAPARAATQEVTIGDTTYAPATITVHVSDTVTWRLTATVSGTSHTVTSDTGSPEGFDSGTLACSLICVTAPTFSHTFGKAGTYPYKCKIVPGMKGVVVVAPATSPSSTPTPSPTVPKSPTPSPTTPSPSASPAPTPSRSASPTPSRSASPTPSPSPTPTVSATTSPTETAIAAAPTSAGGGPSGPVLVAIVSGLVALACTAGLIWLRRTGAW